MVQWLGIVACIADVRVRFSLQSCFFSFFFKELKFFLASYDTLDDPCEGQRPCLERPSRRSIARAEGPVRTPSRRSIARAEGPVRTPLPTILRLYKGRRPGLGHSSNFAQLGEGFFRV